MKVVVRNSHLGNGELCPWSEENGASVETNFVSLRTKGWCALRREMFHDLSHSGEPMAKVSKVLPHHNRFQLGGFEFRLDRELSGIRVILSDEKITHSAKVPILLHIIHEKLPRWIIQGVNEEPGFVDMVETNLGCTDLIVPNMNRDRAATFNAATERSGVLEVHGDAGGLLGCVEVRRGATVEGRPHIEL